MEASSEIDTLSPRLAGGPASRSPMSLLVTTTSPSNTLVCHRTDSTSLCHHGCTAFKQQLFVSKGILCGYHIRLHVEFHCAARLFLGFKVCTSEFLPFDLASGALWVIVAPQRTALAAKSLVVVKVTDVATLGHCTFILGPPCITGIRVDGISSDGVPESNFTILAATSQIGWRPCLAAISTMSPSTSTCCAIQRTTISRSSIIIQDRCNWWWSQNPGLGSHTLDFSDTTISANTCLVLSTHLAVTTVTRPFVFIFDSSMKVCGMT